jgi:putative FmdB family regulatory protein
MPLYEFRCPRGHEFEKFYRSMSAASQSEKCPECGEIAVRRMSAAGLVFKGSGFYITDYGKDGKKAEREAASKSTTSSKTEAKGESKTESKSESKSESKTESTKPEAPAAKPAESKPASSAASKTKKSE